MTLFRVILVKSTVKTISLNIKPLNCLVFNIPTERLRIVEEIIDELLSEIEDLLTGKEKELYAEALEKTRQTTITQDKIELVKDLLPPILRPYGTNPLSILHSILSQGLHGETDEQCIELAMNVREILLFLVNQVTASKVAARNFTESMRKFLDKKSK